MVGFGRLCAANFARQNCGPRRASVSRRWVSVRAALGLGVRVRRAVSRPRRLRLGCECAWALCGWAAERSPRRKALDRRFPDFQYWKINL